MKSQLDKPNLLIKDLGLVDYESSYHAMHEFTQQRDASTIDEIWVLEHPQIFTQGRAGKEEHILQKTSIPIFQSDRGGQVTFHGPGQLIIYPLINLKRYALNIRQFVTILEMSVINTLASLSINAYARKDAPGVYVNATSCFVTKDHHTSISEPKHNVQNRSLLSEKKICSLGLKVSKGCTLHGLALNIDVDLSPFDYINPCGLLGMQMTSIAELTKNPIDKKAITDILINELIAGVTSSYN